MTCLAQVISYALRQHSESNGRIRASGGRLSIEASQRAASILSLREVLTDSMSIPGSAKNTENDRPCIGHFLYLRSGTDGMKFRPFLMPKRMNLYKIELCISHMSG